MGVKRMDKVHVVNDEEVKFLFQNISSKLIIYLLNYLFKDDISLDEKIVLKTNEEVIDVLNFTSIFADFCIETQKHGKFHIEVQTKKEQLMAIRMLHYALGLSDKKKYVQGDCNVLDVVLPKQSIIYINESKEIRREIIRFKLENQDIGEYEIKVLKAWELEDIISKENLYLLIPFVVANIKLYQGKDVVQRISNLFGKFVDILSESQGRKIKSDDIILLFESMERLIYRNCEMVDMGEEKIEEVKMSMGLRYEAKHKGPVTELMDKWRFAESRLVTLENDKQILEHDKKSLEDEVRILQKKLKEAGLM